MKSLDHKGVSSGPSTALHQKPDTAGSHYFMPLVYEPESLAIPVQFIRLLIVLNDV